MPEVQKHGFTFEKWVRDAFFDGYEGGYGQEWDVPAAYNKSLKVPVALRGLPVSIKTAKQGSPIGLGDVLRQRKINSEFVLVAGFWEQRTPTEKWFVAIEPIKFTIESWGSLWSDLDLEELSALDKLVKDMTRHYSEVRVDAQTYKRRPKFATCRIVINPKIDSKTQRRVQCSLPFGVFWQSVGKVAYTSDKPSLWGEFFKNPVLSGSRVFNEE